MDNICETCEENTKLDDMLCTHCHLKNIQYNFFGKIDYIELYKLILIKKEDKSTPRKEVYELIQLQEKIISIFKLETSFDNRIHTKCPCGKTHDRLLHYDNDAHNINCDECGLFCSNCNQTAHNTYEMHKTCDEYSKILFDYDSIIVQNWKMAIITYSKNILKNQENKSNKAIKSLFQTEQSGVKICPYCTYEGAKKYEDDQIRFGRQCDRLTRKYTKSEWYKVACKSGGFPVTKTACDDIICGNHTYGRKTGEGISNKCCNRRINWKYWTKFNPVFDEIIIDKSKLVDVTAYNYANPTYKCDNCQKHKVCISMKCLHKNCNNAHKRICGECICKFKKSKLTKKLTLIEKDGTNILLTIDLTNASEFDRCYHGTRNDLKIDIRHKLYFTNHYVIKTIYGSTATIICDKTLLNLKHGDTVTYYRNTTRYSTYISTKYTVLIDNDISGYQIIDCLEKNHLFEFYGKESLELVMNKINFEKDMCEEKAIMIQKWYKFTNEKYKHKLEYKKKIKAKSETDWTIGTIVFCAFVILLFIKIKN